MKDHAENHSPPKIEKSMPPKTIESSMERAQKVWDAQVDRHARADGTVDIDAFNAESRANAKRLGVAP